MWNKIVLLSIVGLLLAATRLIIEGELHWLYASMVFAVLLAVVDRWSSV